ncbi:MAG: hypothetical protein CMG75_10675 [Candidatus Marinimicrobia bacterium]|nr:hypothetical protein [Candidatus Neomarinimicrobiota bacterium]|tara:strand:+ start:1918 stop:2565 length:648 start_codon:yes stop_codon:yes gene_type:complete
MGYFRELPNLFYKSFLTDKKSSLDYLEVKNLFRRVKLRDDLHNILTIFDKYQIPQGHRPEIVAEEFYGDQELDWVVCMTAGIINIRQDWPLSDRDLWYFCSDKYGEILNNVRHYETTEVKDTNKRLILPKGKVVDSTFTIPKPGEPTATLNPVVGISNYEYEVRLNDKKRSIYLLKPLYLPQFLNDMRDIMTYQQSSQYIDERNIQTENLSLTMP